MALAIDGSTPAVVTQTSSVTPALTTASFTPPANSLLLILWSANNTGGSNPSAPSITDNLGVHLTYTPLDRHARADDANLVDGQAASWSAVVGSSAAMTITVTNGSGANENQAALAVVVLTDTSTPSIGAHGKSDSASAASIAQSYTGTAAGNWGFIAVCDWDALGSMTAGTGCSLLTGGTGTIPTTQISYGFADRTTADGTNGGTTTLNVNLAGTSTHVSWVYVEVVPAVAAPSASGTAGPYSGIAPGVGRPNQMFWSPALLGDATMPAAAAPALPPVSPHRPRPAAPRPRTARTATTVPAQIVVTGPAYPPPNVRARIKPYAILRRTLTPAPPGQAAAPQSGRLTGQLRLKFPRLARGHAVQPVPVQAPVTPPPYPPQPVRGRLRFARIWRGRSATPVPAQAPVTPPAYPPQGLRARLKFLRQARGRATQVIPAQIVVTPPTYPPQPVRTRLRGLRLFRGRTATPVPPQITVTPPPFVANRARQATVKATLARRGHAAAPPVPQQPAPPFTRFRRRLARIFRGETRPVVPPQVVIVPPPYPPQPVRGKKRPWTIRRRRAPLDGWIVGTSASCVAPRPSTGITARPGSGTTAYNTSTTAQPDTGTTTRPDTGTTESPC